MYDDGKLLQWLLEVQWNVEELAYTQISWEYSTYDVN